MSVPILVSETYIRLLAPFHFAEPIPELYNDQPFGMTWVSADLPGTYRYERSPPFLMNVFGTIKDSKKASGYWQLQGGRDRLLTPDNGFVVELPFSKVTSSGRMWRISIQRKGVEIFLPPASAFGVISLSLVARPLKGGTEVSIQDSQDLLSALTEWRSNKTALFVKGAGPAVEARNKFEKYLSVPVEKRLDSEGPIFSASDLFIRFFEPLRGRQGKDLWPNRERLRSILVVRVGSEVTLRSVARPAEVTDADGDLAGFVAAACQAEDRTHPTPPADVPGVHVEMLSSHHLSGVSTQGVCHLVIDQEIKYDDDRADNVQDRYFVDYLAASALRGELTQLTGVARKLVELPPESRTEEMLNRMRLRTGLLLTRSDLLEVSTRDAHNRFYSLAKDALEVDRQLALVQQTTAGLDAQFTMTKQLAISRATQETQTKVEWIEIFLISVYAFEVAEALGGEFHFDHGYVGWGSLVVFALAFGFSVIWVRPYGEEHGEGKVWQAKLISRVRVGLVVLGVFLGVGWFAFRHSVVEIEPEWRELRTARGLTSVLEGEYDSISRELSTRHASPSEYAAAANAFRGRVSEAVSSADLRDQAQAVCGESCLLGRPELRMMQLEAIKAFQQGKFVVAERIWGRVVELAVKRETVKAFGRQKGR